MPYITPETVKAKRQAIKKALPAFKFSVTIHDYSSIRCTIKSGPIAMLDEGVTEETVNGYYIEDHYAEKPEVLDVLLTIQSILSDGNYIESTDGDYGNIPKYYTSLNIGSWDKGYEIIK